MTIHIKIWYENREGEPIQNPKKYPDTITIEGRRERDLTDELVLDLIKIYLRVRRATLEDIVVYWTYLVEDRKKHTVH